jgi:hypothetical protein
MPKLICLNHCRKKELSELKSRFVSMASHEFGRRSAQFVIGLPGGEIYYNRRAIEKKNTFTALSHR